MSYPPQPPPYQPGPGQPDPEHRYTAPGWPPQPMPPAKKRRGPLTWILAAVGVVFALCLAIGIANMGGGGSSENTAGPGAQGAATEKAAAGRKIVLEVTGAKKADITYGLDADQSQDNGARVPWKKELTSTETMTIVVVLAQNKGSGTISCKITLDGVVVKENSSKGEYAVVTCEASEFGF